MSAIRSIASEVDRLVIAVNRAAASSTTEEAEDLAERVGIDDPSLFGYFAEWLLTVGVPASIVAARLPYVESTLVGARIEEWGDRGLVRTESGRLFAEPVLVPLLNGILGARAEVATGLWADAEVLEPLFDLVATATRTLPEGLDVASDHAAIPLPGASCPALHQMLTTLRYARAAAHVDAWTAAGLGRDDVLALTALWRDEPVARGTTERLSALGLADDDGLTVEGLAVRVRIEDDTDARNAPVFAGVDEGMLFALLAELPSD